MLSVNIVIAQTASKKIIQPVRIDTPPVIDGRLDDEVWSNAATVDDLLQTFPNEFDTPTERTIFYLLYDKDALYIGIRAWDSQPDKITAKILRQGNERIMIDDNVAVILDPFNDKRNGYKFITNPLGIRADALYQNTTALIPQWDGIWEVESVITDDGWTSEMVIPYKTLSFDTDNDTWGLNFQRNIARKRESIAWESYNRAVNPSTSGILTGMTGLEQGKGLDIVPGISVRNLRNFTTQDENFDLEPSLDVFYKITSGLNASLTVNTDFSATEVDNRQVSLSRFNLFFPEKRDFFLKDTDIFEFGGIGGVDMTTSLGRVERENARPLFTRRIGLSKGGEPVDLEYGGKISGRIGEWNLGTFAIRQSEFESISPTNIIVARATRNVFDESSFGTIFTQGDPVSNLDNRVYGVDFRYQNSRFANGKSINADLWYLKSDTEGLSGDDAAYGVNVRVPGTSQWRGQASFKEVQANYNPALGFSNRTGIREYRAEAGYILRFRNHYLRRILSAVEAFRVNNIDDGSLQSQLITLRALEFENHADDRLDFRFLFWKEGLKAPFEISDGIFLPAGEYSFFRTSVFFGTGEQRKFSARFLYRQGDYFNGKRLQLFPRLIFNPSKHFNLELSYDFNDIDLIQGDFITRNTSVQTSIVFSNTLSWVNLIQYDNVSDVIGFNSRLHWIPKAGNEMFFVINHNLQDLDDSGSFRSVSSDVTLKLNYTYRF